MKKILVLLFSVFSFTCYSQDQLIHPEFRDHLSLKNELIHYSGVVQAEGLSKDEIYIRMNQWFVKIFSSPKHIIQMQDKEAGKLIGKTQFTYTSGRGLFAVPYIIDFLLILEARDGRFRVQAEDFYQTVSVMNAKNTSPLEVMFVDRKIDKKGVEKIIEYADFITNYINTLFESIKYEVIRPGDNESDDDW